VDLEQAVIYGYDLNSAFKGLQSVLEAKVYPLISEFVTSPLRLPGIFNDLNKEENVKQNVKWAAMLKGKAVQVNSFVEIMQTETICTIKYLDDPQFQEYLQERSTFALLIQTLDDSSNFIAFPGFEDILSPPKYLPEIIDTINAIFTGKGFNKVIFGYGHINFRKGKGLLLHMRLPVPIGYFYNPDDDKKLMICDTVYNVIKTLKEKFKIEPKAEHSPGLFKIWLNTEYRNQLRTDISRIKAFYNPNINIFDTLLKEKLGLNTDALEELNKYDLNLPESMKKDLFIACMKNYIS
jgi:hypothetical protein